MGHNLTRLQAPTSHGPVPKTSWLWVFVLCATGTEGSRTIGCSELDEDAVAAQGDDERLLAHAAALRLTGHRALEYTYIFIYEEKRV